MDEREAWSVGIDPGYRETGVVLLRELPKAEMELVEWCTYSCPKKDAPDLARAVTLAGSVIDLIVEWIDAYDIRRLDVAVEVPVYSRRAGPQTLMKQARLIQELESGLFHLVAGEVDELWVTLVHPSTSKSLAGCGPKEKPIEQSPFKDTSDISAHTRETLADAWAHSLATWGCGGTRELYSSMRSALVRSVYSGPLEVERDHWHQFCNRLRDEEGEE